MFNPILGILASSGAVAGGSFESIATVSVGSGGQSLVEFTSIPSTYKHLQVRIIQTTQSGYTGDWQKMYFNNDTSNSYGGHWLRGDGSSANAYNLGSYTTDAMWYAINRSVDYPTATIIDILDYTDTSKNTTTRNLSGNDSNGSGEVGLVSGAYYNTAAISRISFKPTSATIIPQYSHFALYGIKD